MSEPNISYQIQPTQHPLAAQKTTPSRTIKIDTDRARTILKKKQHSEVEKRRRSKINKWTEKITSLLPHPSVQEPSFKEILNENNVSSKITKGDALEQAYFYICWLTNENNSWKNKFNICHNKCNQVSLENQHLKNVLNQNSENSGQKNENSGANENVKTLIQTASGELV